MLRSCSISHDKRSSHANKRAEIHYALKRSILAEVYEVSLKKNEITKRSDRVVRNPPSYSEGLCFKSRYENRLPYVMLFVSFFSPSRCWNSTLY
jgi:hypothetical protein